MRKPKQYRNGIYHIHIPDLSDSIMILVDKNKVKETTTTAKWMRGKTIHFIDNWVKNNDGIMVLTNE